jgi:hypothetical protein
MDETIALPSHEQNYEKPIVLERVCKYVPLAGLVIAGAATFYSIVPRDAEFFSFQSTKRHFDPPVSETQQKTAAGVGYVGLALTAGSLYMLQKNKRR